MARTYKKDRGECDYCGSDLRNGKCFSCDFEMRKHHRTKGNRDNWKKNSASHKRRNKRTRSSNEEE